MLTIQLSTGSLRTSLSRFLDTPILVEKVGDKYQGLVFLDGENLFKTPLYNSPKYTLQKLQRKAVENYCYSSRYPTVMMSIRGQKQKVVALNELAENFLGDKLNGEPSIFSKWGREYMRKHLLSLKIADIDHLNTKNALIEIKRVSKALFVYSFVNWEDSIY